MRKAALFTFLGMALLATVSWVASCTRPAGEEAGEGEYLNLAPDVRYTGRESCRPCHESIYQSYLETGMGRSFYRPDRGRAIENFGPEAVVHDSYSGFSYRPLWSGKDMVIEEFRLGPLGDTTYVRREKVDYIVGSGHQTRSYILVRGDYYYEMPITWYVARQRWDLSPGYEGGHNTRFDREIGEECLACHTGHIDYVEGSVNRFRAVSLGIDCEKCHGPGQVHIERMEREEIVDVGEEIDYSIVNPAKLSVQRQFDVCMQCHLQGVNVLKEAGSVLDFRPGTELSRSYDIFIEQYDRQEDFGIASHAERLIQSRCFQASGDRLSCTTCHDPHKSIAVTDQNAYSLQCQSCHGDAGTAMCAAPPELRSSQNDNCINCHMPKGGTSDIPHVTFTDHKIRVVRDTVLPAGERRFQRLVCMTDPRPSRDLTGRAYLKYFEQHAPRPEILDSALQYLSGNWAFERAKAEFYAGNHQAALQFINTALEKRPNDPWQMFKKVEILQATGQTQEAITVCEQLYRQRPDLVPVGLKLGELILNNARPEDRESALQRARGIFSACMERKPFDEKVLANMGFVEMNSGNFTRAHELYRRALDQRPDYALALENMVLLQVHSGHPAEGRRYLDQLLAYHPDYGKKAMLEALLE